MTSGTKKGSQGPKIYSPKKPTRKSKLDSPTEEPSGWSSIAVEDTIDYSLTNLPTFEYGDQHNIDSYENYSIMDNADRALVDETQESASCDYDSNGWEPHEEQKVNTNKVRPNRQKDTEGLQSPQVVQPGQKQRRKRKPPIGTEYNCGENDREIVDSTLETLMKSLADRKRSTEISGQAYIDNTIKQAQKETNNALQAFEKSVHNSRDSPALRYSVDLEETQLALKTVTKIRDNKRQRQESTSSSTVATDLSRQAALLLSEISSTNKQMRQLLSKHSEKVSVATKLFKFVMCKLIRCVEFRLQH